MTRYYAYYANREVDPLRCPQCGAALREGVPLGR
jgi:hypothetical protein